MTPSQPMITQTATAHAEIAAALSRAMDRALAAELGPRQLRVLLAVVRHTAGARRLNARVYLADLARHVFGLRHPTPRQVHRMGEDLTALAAAGVIDREPPRRGRPGRDGASYLVWLPDGEP